MVSSKIIIPLSRLLMWEKRQLIEPQELVLPPTREVVPTYETGTSTEPTNYTGTPGHLYVTDKDAAKAQFVRDARKSGSDYVPGDDKPKLEAPPLMGDVLLKKAQGKG